MQVFLDGTTSHTHDAGRSLVSTLWQDVSSKAVVSKSTVARCFYPFGEYTLSLSITDDAMETLATTRTIVVAPDTRVPGMVTAELQHACVLPCEVHVLKMQHLQALLSSTSRMPQLSIRFHLPLTLQLWQAGRSLCLSVTCPTCPGLSFGSQVACTFPGVLSLLVYFWTVFQQLAWPSSSQLMVSASRV